MQYPRIVEVGFDGFAERANEHEHGHEICSNRLPHLRRRAGRFFTLLPLDDILGRKTFFASSIDAGFRAFCGGF